MQQVVCLTFLPMIYQNPQAGMLSTRIGTDYRLEELHIWYFNDVMSYFWIFKVCMEMGDLRSLGIHLLKIHISATFHPFRVILPLLRETKIQTTYIYILFPMFINFYGKAI